MKNIVSRYEQKNNLLFFFNIENKLILPSFLMERTPHKEILLDLLWVLDNYLVIIFPKIKFMLRNYLCLLNMLKLKVNQKTSFHQDLVKTLLELKQDPRFYSTHSEKAKNIRAVVSHLGGYCRRCDLRCWLCRQKTVSQYFQPSQWNEFYMCQMTTVSKWFLLLCILLFFWWSNVKKFLLMGRNWRLFSKYHRKHLHVTFTNDSFLYSELKLRGRWERMDVLSLLVKYIQVIYVKHRN